MCKEKKLHLGWLSMPSMLRCIGSIFDLSGNSLSIDLPKDPAQADLEAIRSDWEAIGEDFRKIISY
ncbi:MAG: hypothetical protein P0Y53_11390 [Candidatus Pseudobacter hemicellulosilyticus]|uniref:Uncharacterized protein n=1 Tax=Candidatus Pseudobacter hemicellulosilyticus TaxID=3121375 RepID=A0AAJ5WVV0_9BACT|nr:MAG: hypothetical protein P0Y53_11390 [Pseudobacter sp.]